MNLFGKANVLDTVPVPAPPKRTRPAPPPPSLADRAQRIADEWRAEARGYAAERAPVEQKITALTAGLDTLAAEVAGLTARRVDLSAQVASIDAMAAIDVPEPDNAASLRTDLAGVRARLEVLRPQIDRVRAELAQAQARRDALIAQEQDANARADKAMTDALSQERAAHIAAIDEMRVRYLHAVLEAGRWNRKHKLVGLSQVEAKKLPVQPVTHKDEAVIHCVPHVESFLTMPSEVDHIHHLLDEQFRALDLPYEPKLRYRCSDIV